MAPTIKLRPLEREAPTVNDEHDPVVLDGGDITAEHGAVELRQLTGIGAVQDD